MKGIILAGGLGKRLFPLTKVTNKHLLPVGEQPMIYHPVRKLVDAEIRRILVVTGPEHIGDIVNQLGSGKDFGCDFTYKVQDEAGGIAQALGLAEEFSAGQPVCVILGDNIFEDPLRPFIDSYTARGRGAQIVLKEVDRPQAFGVAVFDGDRVARIEEKPAQPRSPYAVTGIYFYDARVYDIIRTLKPSGRGELEITDVNNAYIRMNEMTVDYFKGWWTDAGTFPSLALAHSLVMRRTCQCS